MSASNDKSQRRQAYLAKVERLFNTYEKILVINADNIRSLQISNLRRLLRGKAEMLFGKNTLLRHMINHKMGSDKLKALLPFLKLNVGFVMCHGDYKAILEAFHKTRRAAKAKPGMIAPCDVVLQPMMTEMGPDQSAFCASLGLNTKINRGKIEIVTATNLIKAGDAVSPSQASLLQKLNINPFYYEITVKKVYDDGQIFEADILSVDESVMQAKWNTGLAHFVSAALGLHYPCLPAVPHIFMESAKTFVGTGLEVNLTGPIFDRVRAILANPGLFAAAAPAAAGSAAPVQAVEEKEESEEQVVGTGGLFGGDSSSSDESDSD